MIGARWRRRLFGGAIAVLVAAAVATVLAVPFLVRDRHSADAATAQFEPLPPPDPSVPMERVEPPARGVYLGVSNFSLVSTPGAIAKWTVENGQRPRIVNWYQQWLSGERRFRPDWVRRVARGGAIPMITWEPWSAPAGEKHVAVQPDINLRRIAEGAQDRYIRSWARQIAAYKAPIMIRLMHEMNGTWYPWGVRINDNSPNYYKLAWRHVHDIFDEAGAHNVSWIWSINNLERIDGEDHNIRAYYPGAAYVDWVSTSGFNWGTAYSWSSWRGADQLYGDTYRALARFRKPIMISEIGTTTAGGDAREWIRQSFRTLRTSYPKLKAVLWYDDVDGGGLDFRLKGQTEGALGQKGALGPDWLQAPVIVPVEVPPTP